MKPKKDKGVCCHMLGIRGNVTTCYATIKEHTALKQFAKFKRKEILQDCINNPSKYLR